MGKHIKRFTAMHIKSFSYSFHRPLQDLDQDQDTELEKYQRQDTDQESELDQNLDQNLAPDLAPDPDLDIGKAVFRIRFIQDSDHTYKST